MVLPYCLAAAAAAAAAGKEESKQPSCLGVKKTCVAQSFFYSFLLCFDTHNTESISCEQRFLTYLCWVTV
jgi:hypothetical protein